MRRSLLPLGCRGIGPLFSHSAMTGLSRALAFSAGDDDSLAWVEEDQGPSVLDLLDNVGSGNGE